MGRVNVDGVGIEYQVTGEGRPVILLHGWPDSGRLWRHQVPALAAAGFQVIVPDLRGYGRSGKPVDVPAYSPPWRRAQSTTWSPSRSATPPPSAAPPSSARSRGTCCCSSSPASPSA